MSEPKPWRRWYLSTQLAALVAASVLTCAVIVIVETQLFDIYEQRRVLSSLPAGVRDTLLALQNGAIPPPNRIRELINVQRKITDDGSVRSNIALVLFTLTAAIGAFAAGSMMLRRLGGGLNDVAAAAREVAQGNLAARAHAVRWASIEEAQLTEDFNAMAQALAEADRELKDSTAAIAHELRTPLTVLAGRLHGIRDGVFAPGTEQIDSLIHQVDGLARLVDDLRTMSLANSGQLALELAAFDLADAVRPVIEAMQPDLEAVGVQIDAKLKPAPMIGDAGRLRQALSAVLTNVQRYAPDSGQLRVETLRDRSGIRLRVLDRGPGLSDEAMRRAFERFWRGEQSRARTSGGSGLGLSVVRAIAEAHHGSVTLKPRKGGGAVFEMILPPLPPASDTVEPEN